MLMNSNGGREFDHSRSAGTLSQSYYKQVEE